MPASRCRRYPLAWSGLAHDGRDLLIEIAAEGREPGWERIRDSQGGLPATLRLVIYHDIDVIVDPNRSYGQPLVDGSDIHVEDIIDQVRTGASYRDMATKFSLEDFEVEALVRPHIRPPAIRKLRPRHQPEALL